MRALFVLLPPAADVDAAFAGVLAAHAPDLRLRKYPRATNAEHLLSLLRDGRDPLATRWIRGTVLAVFAGGVLGAIVNGVLADRFDMLGGLLSLALPLGFGIGAFLGGFTAAMTGTHVARDELKRLAGKVHLGDVLLQWTGTPHALAAAAARGRELGLATTAVR